MDSLKIVFGLNHCKCTGRTSNKSGFLSPDIIPMRIDDNQKTTTPTTQDPYYFNSNVKLIRELIK